MNRPQHPLTALLASGPVHGSLTLSANGGFTYTPNPNYYGSDSFTYRARDGQSNSAATIVSLTVTQVLDAEASGTVFNDLDQDGLYEPAAGETPLSGRVVYVDLNNNGVDVHGPGARLARPIAELRRQFYRSRSGRYSHGAN